MSNKLQLRADGWAETPDGALAVVMMVRTRIEGGLVVFRYQPTFTSPPLQLQWRVEDTLQIFPPEIAAHMVNMRWAKRPDARLIEAHNAALGAEPEPPVAPQESGEGKPSDPPADGDEAAKRRGKPPKAKPEGD